MAAHNGQNMAKLKATPVQYPDAADFGGRVRIINETVVLAGQAADDTIAVGRLPKGARLLFGLLMSDTSLATATVAIGSAADAGKYRAAATFTTTNAPVLFGVMTGAPVESEEEIVITVGTAALPDEGMLRVQLFFSID